MLKIPKLAIELDEILVHLRESNHLGPLPYTCCRALNFSAPTNLRFGAGVGLGAGAGVDGALSAFSALFRLMVTQSA